MTSRVGLVALIMILPLLVFVCFAIVGLMSLDIATLVLVLLLGAPFWLLVVLPLYALSRRGQRWSLTLSVGICFLIVATFYVSGLWVPHVYTLEIGGKVLVHNGVATSSYYKELVTDVAAAAISVLISFPVFVRIVRARPTNDTSV